jgi:predicted RNA binding protein YcfA (HicA-like mRNA interferase family)
MTRLPMLSGHECIKALQRAGFQVIRQTGSHIILQRQEPPATVVVPNHDELDRGTLKAILRQAGISHQTFIDLL